MKKLWCITIKFKDKKRKTLVYPEDQVAGWRFIENGFLCIQIIDKEGKPYKNNKNETVYEVVTSTRFFSPHDIECVFVDQTARFTGDVEILKYHKFLEHGINMIHTQVSHTEVDRNKIAQEVEKDKLVLIAKEKAARLANQQKKKISN